MAKKIRLIAVFLFCGTALFAQENLSWSMSLVKDNEGVSFSRPLTMKDGDSFNIIVRTRQDSYVYVIVQDSERNMLSLLSRRLSAGGTCQTGFLKLTPPSGAENFYVIVSLTEQKELQNVIDIHKNQNTSRTGRDLQNAVLALRRSVSAFKEDAERPVTMAGAFRGTDFGGTEFSGAPAYVKTIIINH